MSALHILKLKLHMGDVASKTFGVAPVFIYYNGLLVSDIIREDMQHAKLEFLYKDYYIKSAKTSGNIDALQLLGQPVSLFLKLTQDEEVQDLLVVIYPPCIKYSKFVNAFGIMKKAALPCHNRLKSQFQLSDVIEFQ